MKSNHHSRLRSLFAVSLATSLAFAASSQAAFVSYYVGTDSLVTLGGSGIYAGLPNLNAGKLTFLYAHTYTDTPNINHYHSKGLMRYTGDNLGAATATEVNPNFYLPEGARPPLQLTFASSGLYNGKMVSAPEVGNPFSFLTISDTQQLAGFGPGAPESILFNSSANRWNGPLAGADVRLELVSLTPGLNVGSTFTRNLFVAPGDDQRLGEVFIFTPTFWTEAGATPGDYRAQFKLTDGNNLFADSGNFEFRFNVIPEPSSALLGAIGALALLRRRR